MTEPRAMQRERETEAMTADREPEVNPEVIQDLDMTGGDAENIARRALYTLDDQPR